MSTPSNGTTVGIASFNNTETISSCRIWRRKIVSETAASSFRTSGSLTAACSAIRRRATQLIRQLGLQVETKQQKSSKNPPPAEDFSAVHELIRLVGNATFFDVLSRLTVKDSGVIPQLGTLLEFGDLRVDIACSVVRLFGNLCECKEGATAVLQTKPCVRVITQWLTKNLDCESERSSTTPQVDGQNIAQLLKLREQCVRALRNAAACGRNFAQYLVRSDAVYAVGRCVCVLNSGDWKKQDQSKNIQSNSFQLFQLLLLLKDRNFSQQILRADISEKLMEFVNSSGDGKSVDAITKVVLGMIVNYSSLRIELAKFGAVEWTKNRVEKILDDGGVESNSASTSNNGQDLIALIRFCRDAFTRPKLRETGALDLLLKIFVSGQLKETIFTNEMMASFLCFLYDDQDLKYLIEYDGFLSSVVSTVQLFTSNFPCTSAHNSKTGDGPNGEEAKEDSTRADASSEFRADSPSYKRFRVDPAPNGNEHDVGLFEGPLCKDFTNAALSPNGWSSPNGVSPRYMPSPSSPGPAWSPSASSFHSFSSVGSSSPPFAGASSGNGSCWSPASDSRRSADDWEYAELEHDFERRYSNFSQEESSPLCECDLSTKENSDEYKGKERVLWAAIKFLSWLSHGIHSSHLVMDKILDVLLAYIGGVCRPEPRVGRLVERLTRNRLFTETLLNLEFHMKLTDALCMTKCGDANDTAKRCLRCRKLCKIGCGIMKSFQAQVDTNFGIGTLEHMIAFGDDKTKLKCVCAMLFLARSNWRVKRFMAGEQGGLNILLSVLSSNESDTESLRNVAKTIYAAVDTDAARERFIRISSLDSASSNICQYPSSTRVNEENRVEFLEKDGDGRIECDVTVLTSLSPFYRAMFSGSYSESNQRSFVYDEGDCGKNNFASFVFYLHYLHGCRNCDRARLHSSLDCISALELADKRLCSTMADFVVSTNVPHYLRIDNLMEFISNAILRKDTALFGLCMDYALSQCCGVGTMLNVCSEFRASTRSGKEEGFQMLGHYLRTEWGFE